MRKPLRSTLQLLLLLGVSGAAAGQSTPAQQPDPADRPADRQAINALVQSAVAAYNADDAATLAAQFIPDGEIVTEDGSVIAGRDAIAEFYARTFEENPDHTIAVESETLRFLTPDTAQERGSATITAADGTATESGRYSVLYILRDGKWLQAEVRNESAAPATPTPRERLEELSWMLGQWINESDEANVHLDCNLIDNGNFLERRFDVRIEGTVALSGSQRIGWDPLRNQFRVWTFDDEGGFGEGLISRAGDQWIVKSNGVRQDGQTVSATSVITPLGPDRVAWQTVDRTVDGEAVPDIDEFILVRKPPAPVEAP